MRFKLEERSRRQGKSEAGLKLVGMFIAANKELMIGSHNTDKLYNQIKELYPDAKLSKHDGYVKVEKRNEKS